MNASLYIIFVEVTDYFPAKAESLHIETYEKLCQEFDRVFRWMQSADVPGVIAH